MHKEKIIQRSFAGRVRRQGCQGCAVCAVWLLCSGLAAGQAPVETTPTPAETDGERVVPPRVVERVDAIYPERAHGREARVELFVTVAKDGTVSDVDIAQSGGVDFDEAAIRAVRRWRFVPAKRGDTPLPSRIRVPFRFELPRGHSDATNLWKRPAEGARARTRSAASSPEPEKPEVDVSGAGAASSDAPSTAGPAGLAAESQGTPLIVTVEGERELRSEARSVSDFTLDRDVLVAAPRMEGAELLRSAPGVYIGRGEGVAVAHNYMLRGFDAEHGQDIEFRVGGLPINLPAHVHGQGYADLGFLIGDVARELRVSEGVYDPRQGDFAVAGSIEVELGVERPERGVRLRSGYGSFNTQKHLVLWAPREAPEETFGAAEYTVSDGFGENRKARVGSAIFQNRFGEGDTTYRTIGILHAARSSLAGVLRQDDIDAERVCFYCVYPHATARRQNALANRYLAGFFADHEDPEGANGQFGVWLGYDSSRVQKNFTGFVETSRTLARVAGRGDLIEQQNRTFSLGLTGRYRTAPFRPSSWAHGTIEVGADGRLDSIDQAQNLIDAATRNQTWDERIDASIRGMDLGLWGDLDWTVARYVRARLGLRADVLSYDIEDRLGNFTPLTRPSDSFIVGFRRSAFGVAVGPRTSLEVHPLAWLTLLGAYGEGYRSPQARILEDGEPAPFSKVRSADAGVRFDWGDPLHLTLGSYYTHLSDDVAFDAAEGRLERIGATERLGAVAYAVSRPAPWLVSSLSLTLVRATLLEPPPASADDPEPAFEEGQRLPFVPPAVLRADVGAEPTLAKSAFGKRLGARAGFGFSALSPRPLPYGGFAEPVVLLDAAAGLSWGPLELSLEVFNAFDLGYAAVEYNFPSDWDPDDGVRPRTPARHIAAGSPRSFLVSLGVTL